MSTLNSSTSPKKLDDTSPAMDRFKQNFRRLAASADGAFAEFDKVQRAMQEKSSNIAEINIGLTFNIMNLEKEKTELKNKLEECKCSAYENEITDLKEEIKELKKKLDECRCSDNQAAEIRESCEDENAFIDLVAEDEEFFTVLDFNGS